MDATMNELKRRIIEHMERTRAVAERYDRMDLQNISNQEWCRYYGLDWVLDTIAELEAKDAGEVSQEGGKAE